jgi:hypothetical protein
MSALRNSNRNIVEGISLILGQCLVQNDCAMTVNTDHVFLFNCFLIIKLYMLI